MIIPTYNEADNLPLILGRLFAAVPSAQALVVDDGSPDGTGEVADKLATEDGRIEVLHRTEKAGLGAAYVAGFRRGLAAGYDVLVEMDADGSHAPEQLPRLLTALEHADLVLGSRWVPGGQVRNWPKSREALSRGGNLYTRLALGIGAPRRHRRLPGLPACGAGGNRPGLDRFAGLLLPGRPGLARGAGGLPGGRGAHHVRRPGARRVQDERQHRAGGAVQVTEWGAAHRAAQLRGLLRRGD